LIELDVPGLGLLSLEHLVLDLNGTVAVDGEVLPGVAERLRLLYKALQVHLVSADTRGQAAETAARLGVVWERVSPGAEAAQKGEFVERLGASRVAAIGNGANDVAMLRSAALGLAVLQGEGLAVAALMAADLVVGSVEDALDLLLKPARLVASLRR